MSLYSRFHERFGTAGVILGMIALILALGGSAFAASGGLSGPEKTLIKKEAKKWGKKFAKTGPAGPQGAPGTPGTNGTNGKDGTNGTNGTDGADGTDGTNGKSIEVTEIEVGEVECNAQGGALVKVEGEPASAQEVCNGEPGMIHAGETLPVGATETGAWSTTDETGAGLSFPVPLAAPLAESHVVFVTRAKFQAAELPAECDNGEGAPAGPENPEADSGYLCVFEGRARTVEASLITPAGAENLFPQGSSPSGAQLVVITSEPGTTWGTYAVTG